LFQFSSIYFRDVVFTDWPTFNGVTFEEKADVLFKNVRNGNDVDIKVTVNNNVSNNSGLVLEIISELN